MSDVAAEPTPVTISDKITFADIATGARVQSRVIFALILREAKTRYGRHKLGFFWIFVEPLFFVAIFIGFKLLIRGGDSSGGMPDALFLITGLIPFLLFRQTMNSLSGAIRGARSLLGFPQVTTFDIIMANVLLECATLMFVFAIIIVGANMLVAPESIENPLMVIYPIMLLGLSGTGMGMVFASLVPIFPAIKNITNPLFGRPLFFTSGIFFTAEMLPKSARDIVLYNPLLHMLEMLRSAYFIQFESQYVNGHYASMFAFTLFLTGLLMHQVLKDKAVKAS